MGLLVVIFDVYRQKISIGFSVLPDLCFPLSALDKTDDHQEQSGFRVAP
jgi:hypothetical protein